MPEFNPEFNSIPTWVPKSNLNVTNIPTTKRVLHYVSDQLPEGLYNRVEFMMDKGIIGVDELTNILVSTSSFIDETREMLPDEIAKVTNALEKAIGNFGNVTAEQVVHFLKNFNALIEKDGVIHQEYTKGSENVANGLNTGTAIVGVGSTAYATACILQAKNPFSKTFYILGASCSAMGTCMSTYSSLFGDSCCYNFGGLFAIGSGTMITFIGKRCVDTADFLEGKKKNRRWFGIPRGGSAIQLSYRYRNGDTIAFTLPAYLQRVPYGKIFTGTMFVLTIYGYGKLIVSFYRYGQQLVSRPKNKPQLKLIRKQITYFAFYLWNCERITNIRRIRHYSLLKSY